jgi:AcrR family transcriptional regulator
VIAKQMGMTAPAFYSYFADRDALIATRADRVATVAPGGLCRRARLGFGR